LVTLGLCLYVKLSFFDAEDWVAAALNGGLAYFLFGPLLGLPPFNKLMK
tara:strand:+ start:102 stop:248 length:147 start_codon:yes stop_codon:yes gene_type:complete